MEKRKIVEKICLLQDIFDESSRLQPLLLTLIDDFDTNRFRMAFLGALINRIGSKSKQIDVLLLGSEESKFYCSTNVQLKPNIRLINQINLDLNNTQDTIIEKLICSKKINKNNCLVIDTINPLCLLLDDDTEKEIVKPLCRFIKKLTNYYSQIILTFHSDSCFDSDQESIEAGLSYISNVIVDFRDDKCQHCTDSNYHCIVTAKKKHPRTQFKIDRKHEHFRIADSGSIEFIGQDSLILKETKENYVEQDAPQSSFRLTLSKQEQEAKENLVLPYIKNDASGKGPGGSKIIYTYDKFDDYDDEDPDDDLDF